MAEKELEPEVQSILKYIGEGKNFLLSGGAGSGKTYSLTSVIKTVLENYPTAKVACMTYTNAAVKEIEDRVRHENLSVSTLHDFLWDNIKSYKGELRRSLIYLLNSKDSKIKKPSNIKEEKIADNYFDSLENGIQYKEYIKIIEGIISHDELLELANHMFANYRLLSDILKDKYQFIFIDEYQDTHPFVIEILLTHLKNSKKKNIIGFFGDSMQAIYDDGIGDLKEYVDKKDIIEVIKAQNRRNPLSVIELANKIRTDSVKQEPSKDKNAPNMQDGIMKNGTITFLYSKGKTLEEIKKNKVFANWNFTNSKQVKELNLTHNLIAAKVGFPTLMEIYDKDPIMKLKADLVKELKKREKNGEVIEISEDTTFDEIVDTIKLTQGKGKNKVLRKDELLKDSQSRILYEKLKDRSFIEVRRIYLDKDSLIDDKKQDAEQESKKGAKRDRLIRHLFKIQTNIHLYQTGSYNEFLRKTDFKIRSISDKKKLKEIINSLVDETSSTIEKVIENAHEKGICYKDDSYNNFIAQNDYLFDRIRHVKYKEFQNLYYYLEGYTPYSTQHKTKGTEFDNVLVVLDNGSWNNYDFKTLFGSGSSNKNVIKRTQKIFYVCCTRTKENLVVYFDSPDDHIISTASELFGKENIIEII